MNDFTWSWSRLNITKTVNNISFGQLFYVDFPDAATLARIYPKMHCNTFPVNVMIRGEQMANLYADDELFPYIEGSMLQDKRKIVTLSGEYTVLKVEGTRGDEKPYLEIGFSDTKKRAKLSKGQYKAMMAVIGGDTDKWQGMRVVLYGEFGRWFRKKNEPGIWALRVDVERTAAENNLPVPK